jgi:hypothetical protein
MVIACGRRSRSPGVSGPLTSPCCRALSSAASSALFVELDVHACQLPQLQRDAQLDAASGDMLRDQRAEVALDGRQRMRVPELQIEMPMVHGANRDADRGTLVFSRDRGEPGHALDHDGTIRVSAFLPSSSCSWYSMA